MDRQRVFDRVRAHLLKQGKKSIGPYGCAYRGEDGAMCAIGCLIPDEAYDSRIEGRSVISLYDQMRHGRAASETAIRAIETEFGLTVLHDDAFLSQLQSVHDGCDPSEWDDGLKELAARHGLEVRD